MNSPKVKNVASIIERFIETGCYYETLHAQRRMNERNLTRLDVKHVLLTGKRETKRDRYSKEFGAWTYGMRGFTLDGGREVRVVFALDEHALAVVTAVELAEEDLH